MKYLVAAGSKTTLDCFLATSGFTKQEIKRVRKAEDIKGWKDTILFTTSDCYSETVPELAEMWRYAKSHNIKRVLV